MDKLIPDVYEGDFNGKLNMDNLRAAGFPWCGIGLKVSQSTWYPSKPTWLNKYWPQATSTKEFRRYGYHYADLQVKDFTAAGIAQARWFASKIKNAGGCSGYDLPPMLDIEGAGNPDIISADSISFFVYAFANELLAIGMERPVLYGNIYLREHGYKGLNGCAGIVVARYTPTLPASILAQLGITPDKLAGWQYTGTESRMPTDTPFSDKAKGTHYPVFCPVAPGSFCDITAWQWPFKDEVNGHPYH